jgi:thioredoxin-like negative regulator of GroEL
VVRRTTKHFELQRKMDFDALKEILQNWLNPEEEKMKMKKKKVDIEAVAEEDPLLAKAKEEPKTNYSLKTKTAPKVSKADKFDALFETKTKANKVHHSK